MVHYEIPKPPQTFFQRTRDSVRLAAAFLKGDKTTIADITAETIFSPLQPLTPFSPMTTGRAWDYAPGLNIQFLPRGYGSGRIPFQNLRTVSRECEILRLVMETVKDQICAFEWQIVPKEDSEAAPDDERIDELTTRFKKPDNILSFEQWLRVLLDEVMTIDALSIYRPKDRIGRPYAFEILDGGMIKPLIDANGRRPLPPDPAFQQVIKGAPRVDYTTDELLYAPRTTLADNPVYGYSLVEQTLITAQTSIQRSKYQLAYFTEGSVPDAYAALPEGMTMDQIKAFEDRFNGILRGNAVQRRQMPFVPAGTKFESMKQPPLKDEFDEWIARIICFSFGLSPSAFIKQINRATAGSEKERAQEEGQAPKLQFIKWIMDSLISDFGEDYADNFEFSWKENANADKAEQATTDDKNVRNGTATINEVRASRGQDPVEGGDKPMFATANGYVTIEPQAQPEPGEEGAQPGQDDDEGGEPAPDPKKEAQQAEAHGKAVYARLRKAVRHEPIPLDAKHPECDPNR